jgi:S1-C subfamily serine protease
MLAVDIAVGAVIAVAVLGGLAVGAARTLPVAGFAIGAVLGSRLPLLLGADLDSDFSLAAALPGALLAGALLGALAERFAWGLNRRVRRRPRLDALGGALLAGIAGVVAVWLLAPAAAELRPVRDSIAQSEVLGGLNDVLRAAGPDRRPEPAPIMELPTFVGRGPNVAAGDPAILSDPDVAAAERSVARIRSTSCRGHPMGSGWVAAEGIVATNAHVISGSHSITVQPGGTGPAYPAVPIWFDVANDIALLRVPRLSGVRVLPMVSEPRAGTSGAVLGFPFGRRAIRRARVGPTTDRAIGRLTGPPGASNRITGRLVTLVRGRARPGNSGGPVVDARGRVLTTVFAGNLAGVTIGVPNRFVRAGLRRAGPPVSTGRCSRPMRGPRRG